MLVAVPSNRHPESAEKKMLLGSRVVVISRGSVECGGTILNLINNTPKSKKQCLASYTYTERPKS